MDKLTEDFKNSLIVMEDEIEDYLELGIDSFIEEGILKEIPIVKTIVSVLKTAKNIYDRNLLRRTLEFRKELNNGTLSKDKLIEYRTTIENDPKKCEEELGRVLILLNSYIDKEKAIMLAKLFKSYVKEEITWSEFCEYSEIINRLFIQDIIILSSSDMSVMVKADYYIIERLNSLGIINVFSKPHFDKNEFKTEATNYSGYKYLKLNDYGLKFMKIIK